MGGNQVTVGGKGVLEGTRIEWEEWERTRLKWCIVGGKQARVGGKGVVAQNSARRLSAASLAQKVAPRKLNCLSAKSNSSFDAIVEHACASLL